MSSLDLLLQRALSVRLNLQISLSQLEIVEEWMDIHLDRWLEHNPMPHEMPMGESVTYLAMLGSDLRRVWWGAWGSPGGFVPKMADYFKLCNIQKSDAALLDQIGEHLEPRQVGSWIGVSGKKVVTGWHFWDPHEWSKVENMLGTHEAKYKLKSWVEANHVPQIERFTQSIGDSAFSEMEFRMPGDTVEQQVDTLSDAFAQFTGAPLEPGVVAQLKAHASPAFALAVRIRGGAITRVGALLPAMPLADIEKLCKETKLGYDAKLPKLCGALGNAIVRVEYGRAGDRAGLDVYLEPNDAAPKGMEAAVSSVQSN